MQKEKLLQILVVCIVTATVCTSLFFTMMNEIEFSTTSLKIDSSKLDAIDLKSLALTLEDLPEGYEFDAEGNASDDEEEASYIKFVYNGTEPEKYASLTVFLFKSIQSDQIINRVEHEKEVFYYEFYNVTEISREIGEENFIAVVDTSDSWKNFAPGMITDITFKVSKIFCSIVWQSDDNFDFIFDLAKTIEQRIYDNIT